MLKLERISTWGLEAVSGKGVCRKVGTTLKEKILRHLSQPPDYPPAKSQLRLPFSGTSVTAREKIQRGIRRDNGDKESAEPFSVLKNPLSLSP